MRGKVPTPMPQKQSLAVKEASTEKPTVYKDSNGQEVSLSTFIINKYLAPGANFTEEECWGLIGLAQSRGLNPIVKDVYFLRYQGNPQIVVSRDYYEKRAAKNPNFSGKENGIVVLNKKGEIEYRQGTIMLKDEELLGGWCKVYMRNLTYPVFTSVQFDEAVRLKADGKPMATWASMPKTMVEKVAVVRALKQAMTEDFGGTYSAVELGFDDDEIDSKVQEVPKEQSQFTPNIVTDTPEPEKQSQNVDAIEADFIPVDEATGEVQEPDEDEFDSMQKSFFENF